MTGPSRSRFSPRIAKEQKNGHQATFIFLLNDGHQHLGVYEGKIL